MWGIRPGVVRWCTIWLGVGNKDVVQGCDYQRGASADVEDGGQSRGFAESQCLTICRRNLRRIGRSSIAICRRGLSMDLIVRG